jgi:hypothetical protein
MARSRILPELYHHLVKACRKVATGAVLYPSCRSTKIEIWQILRKCKGIYVLLIVKRYM